MDEKFDGRLWAVVTAGGIRYLGVVGSDDALQDDILEGVGKNFPLILRDGCELPLPAQLGPQGFGRIPIAVPIDITVDPVPIYLSRVSSIYFIADLSPDDQKALLTIRKELEKSLQAQKAARAGLVLR